jgi:hypothetical protein
MITIDASTKKSMSAEDLQGIKMEDHSLVHTLINIIIKEALRGSNLTHSLSVY